MPYRSVAENVFLGREPRRFGLIDWRRIHRETETLLARFGIDVDVRRPLGSFNIAIQQMVAIARAVSFDARLVVMDEPTSSLDDQEVEVLFDVIRNLKRGGVSVVFVSHRLDELYAVCDRVTVMRDGRTVAESPMADLGKLDLVAAMLGRRLSDVAAAGRPASPRARSTGAASRWSGSTVSARAAASRMPASRSGPARSSGWPGCWAQAAPRSPASCSAPTRRTAATSG